MVSCPFWCWSSDTLSIVCIVGIAIPISRVTLRSPGDGKWMITASEWRLENECVFLRWFSFRGLLRPCSAKRKRLFRHWISAHRLLKVQAKSKTNSCHFHSDDDNYSHTFSYKTLQLFFNCTLYSVKGHICMKYIYSSSRVEVPIFHSWTQLKTTQASSELKLSLPWTVASKLQPL